MYAIVETGGKQYRVKPGDTIAVERLAGQPGEVLDLDRVLLVSANDDGAARIGSPGVDGAVVRAEVVEHARGEKIIVFRYKSKVRYRRKTGHRQALTRLRITDIVLAGQSSAAAAGGSALPPDEAQVTQVARPAEAEDAAAPTPTRRRRTAPPPEENEAASPPSERQADAVPPPDEESPHSSTE
jgi:large subunit ribosomal protein L21